MQFVKTYDYSPELIDNILASVDNVLEKSLIGQIIEEFYKAGLFIKIKHCFPDMPKAYYRISCFIKKSSEAVIINTRQDLGKDGVVDGLNVQIRITDQYTLNNLDQLSENVRNQIVNANDCRYCSEKCIGKKYVFSYNNVDYTKCQYLCSNFRIMIENTDDVKSVMDIIQAEISYKKPNKKV